MHFLFQADVEMVSCEPSVLYIW